MYHFDQVIDRRSTDSVKWRHYPADVLPLWVADMDFRAPQSIIDAIDRMNEVGIYGYGSPLGDQALLEAWQLRLASRYRWQVGHDDLVLLPGVVTGANLACKALGQMGAQALVPAPVYGPLLAAPRYGKLECVPVPLAYDASGYASLSTELLEDAVTSASRVLILCNPHNPVGRVYTRAELEALADFVLRHNLTLISDEIHCDFFYPGHQHIPIATLAPEIAARTITLMAPTKTYNIPGLHSAVAVITDASLRARLRAEMAGVVPELEPLAKAATVAAFEGGQQWLDELLAYLRSNRDFLAEAVRTRLPGIRMVAPEGTYLGWLDCRQAHLGKPAYQFFLEEAKVALNDGCSFGEGNEGGYARLNFGCPRAILAQALDRMAEAWARYA